MFNTELAERVLGRIIADPKSHTQTNWRCSTGMCFAGHAADVSGLRWQNEIPTSGGYVDGLVEFNGRVVHVSEVAQTILGLSQREADILFHSGNTLEDLQRYVKNLSNGDPIDKGMYDTAGDDSSGN